MAVGDRVRIDVGTVLFKTVGDFIVVYAPVLGPDQLPVMDKTGCVKLQRQGGVKSGSTGVIAGSALRCHRSELVESTSQEALTNLGNDFVDVFPVMLDHYQKIGWFPLDHVKQFFEKS